MFRLRLVFGGGGGNGGAACPFSFYCFQTKHLLRGMVGRRGAPRGTFPTETEVPVEMSLCRRRFRRCLLVVIFPSGKTSATGAPPVSACEAGGRCRCAQFGNIRLIGMLLGCLEGLPVWRVFCWKPLSRSVIMTWLQICTRHGSKASIQDGRTGKLKNLIKNFPSLICFCPTQPCRLHRLTVQSVSLTGRTDAAWL